MTRFRFAYLQKAPSGHSNACLRALAATGCAELFVTTPPTLADAPYELAALDGFSTTYRLASLRRDDGLVDALTRFRPDVVLIVGWEQPAYRRCARALRGSSIRVVGMDNQWLRTPKQLLGIASSRVYLRPYFDAAFLPGRRQLEFALRLGFARGRIFEGFYSADVDAFQRVPDLGADADTRNAFVYAGRLVDEKGIAILAEAYARYRRQVDDPWQLVVIGCGPLDGLLRGSRGVELRGFVAPTRLPDEFERASFLMLPSTFEPWGVVVHEAAAAGLGCICTTRVGAADAFVRDGENGRIVEPGAPDDLAAAMQWAHSLDAAERADVSAVSRSLAERVTPSDWAARVIEMAELAR
jgi:glycosyltransferase involved in cell wall biosynthesis